MKQANLVGFESIKESRIDTPVDSQLLHIQKQTYTLAQVCQRLSSGKSITASDISESGKYPVYGANGVRGYTSTSNFKGECAIIGRQGAYCGNVHYFAGEAYMSEHAVVAHPNELADARYLAYLLRLMDLSRLQGQSAQPGLSVQTLGKQKIQLPDITTQQYIGKLLGALDEKIALNQRLNDNLEAMAQALYDYWFVQFDFPDENGKPYKSSGGKMVWNEQHKREIPEGWTCVTIQEMADVIGGSTPYTQDPDNFSTDNESGIPWITPKDLSKSTDFYIAKGEVSITEKGRKEASLTYLPPGSILFSSRAPIGYVAIAADFVTTNQGFKSLAPLNPESTPYLFFLMKSMVPYFEQAAGITTFKEVSGSQVKAAKIVKPSDSVLQKFFDVTKPIMNRRKSTETEIKDLTKQRDFLLPLLMNGQVQVKPLNYRLSAD